MKKLLVTILVLLFIQQISIAQTEKGKFEISPSISMNLNYSKDTEKSESDYSRDVNTNTVSFRIHPKLGYFFFDNFVAGLGVSYYTEVKKTKPFDKKLDEDLKSTSNSIALYPYVKYYFGQGKLRPFVGASFSYGKRYSKYDRLQYGNNYPDDAKVVNEKSEVDFYSYAIFPGVSYFINDHISLDAMIEYSHFKLSYDESYIDYQKTNNFNVNVGVSIFL